MIAVFFLGTSILVLSHTNYLDYESPINFEKYDEITLENFRGIELFRKTHNGNKRFAYIVTTIDYEIEEDSVTVQSFFHPSRSFVYKQNAFSKELLTHEKYHFKITELYARMARKELSQLKEMNSQKVKSVIRMMREAERAYQRLYDKDTFHSYVYGEQKRYEREIDSMLVLLSKFEYPKVKYHESR